MARSYQLSIRAATILVSLAQFGAQTRVNAGDPRSIKGGGAYEIITGSPTNSQRTRWDKVYTKGEYVYGTEPAQFLREVLPRTKPGQALDIAMGEGRNAVFLAQKGFRVRGVDFSEVAIRKALRLAKQRGVRFEAINSELSKFAMGEQSLDLVVNINYLDRNLIPRIKKALKPGGYLVFETQTEDQLKNPDGLATPREFLLLKGELRGLFSDFEILIYRETNDGRNAVASLFARKPLGP